MSGDHSTTTSHNISLLTQELKLEKIGNSSLFYREGLLVFSPAVKKNSQGYYWFDIREANIERKERLALEQCYLLIRIVPDKFILCPFDQIKPILVSHRKAHADKKAWGFKIEDGFTVIKNQRSEDRIRVELVTREQIIELLGKRIP